MKNNNGKEEMRRKQAINKNKKFTHIMAIVYTVLMVVFMGVIIWLNMLPAKLIIPMFAVMLLIYVFTGPMLLSGKGKEKRRKIVTVITAVLTVLYGLGSFMLMDTLDFLSDVTGAAGINTEDYYIVVDSDSDYKKIKHIKEETVGVLTEGDSYYTEAKDMLSEKVDVEFEYAADETTLMNELLADTKEIILVSSTAYNNMIENDDAIVDETKIIHTISVEVSGAVEAKKVDVTEESFNVYISGIDTTGALSNVSRSDVNMVVTVNPRTNEVIITSIPRDYYVTLPSKGALDKLTHSGLYGIDESIAAAEAFLGTEINYYARVNFTTIVSLIDAIGGVDIDSPISFTTSGMGRLNGITFVEGHNHLDGDMALAYCRERESFLNGDLQRNENQQLILEAVINKLTSSATIVTRYSGILDAVRGNMETNFSAAEMKDLVKYQLAGMPSWDIEKIALKGTPSMAHCYALGFSASVVLPDYDQVAKTSAQINAVMANEEN